MSRNVTEIKNFVKQILKNEILDLVIVLQIKKLHKIAVKAIADTTIQSSTNEELLMQLKKHKKREARTNEWLADYDRYLESEVLKEHAAKHLQAVWKDLLWLDHHLFSEIKKKSVIKLSDHDDTQKKFLAAVRSFLQLNSVIFIAIILIIWISESTNSNIEKKQCF